MGSPKGQGWGSVSKTEWVRIRESSVIWLYVQQPYREATVIAAAATAPKTEGVQLNGKSPEGREQPPLH